ncbi:MAG TPA: holo-ACP synthase [bacterium]|nr:holo-ACP synthase [bacterium]
MIRGLGIDIIEVDRIRRAIARWGEAFLCRVFTPDERARGGASRGAAERLAGRFAAKEAVMKALGLGRPGVGWQEIEITVDPFGKPGVRLTGRAATVAEHLGVRAWHVSISHTRLLAVAEALAE